MKVLCLNPPSEQGLIRTGRWVRTTRANQSWSPIWLEYLVAVLQKHNYNVGLLDASISGMSEELAYLYIKKLLQPDVIFYYWAYDTMETDVAFADKLATFSRVILVGPWSLCAPQALLLTKNIHIMTYGEFEHTCLELLQSNHYTDVKGIIWRNHIDNKIHKNPPRPLCSTQELDEIPFVSSVCKQFLNLKDYRQTSLKYPFIDIIGARGCPNRCVDSHSLITMADSTHKVLSAVAEGDSVLTLFGAGRVTNKNTYSEPTLAITLENNTTISATADHKFWTKRGWANAEELHEGDEVLCLLD